MHKANVYLWSEKALHVYVRLFKSLGLHLHKIVCTEPKELNMVDDVEIISPDDLLKDDSPRKYFFMDALSYSTEDPATIWNKQLAILPHVASHIINARERMTLLSLHAIFDVDKLHYYQSHQAEIMELFDSLVDYRSKLTLYYYVECFVTNSFYKGEHNPTRCKYFFGSEHERLYKHLDGECWINCGASNGDTIFSYFSWDFKPKRVYAFESNRKRYAVMLKNLSMLPPEKHALVMPINQLITEQIDFKKILAGNRCTLLNADIEGAELNLLHAMKNVIQADRPVIALCVYHFTTDLLSVPLFLQSICRDYVYYLRKYTPYFGYPKKNGELVLYAVPMERSMLPTPSLRVRIMLICNRLLRDKSVSNDIIAALKFAA